MVKKYKSIPCDHIVGITRDKKLIRKSFMDFVKCAKPFAFCPVCSMFLGDVDINIDNCGELLDRFTLHMRASYQLKDELLAKLYKSADAIVTSMDDMVPATKEDLYINSVLYIKYDRLPDNVKPQLMKKPLLYILIVKKILNVRKKYCEFINLIDGRLYTLENAYVKNSQRRNNSEIKDKVYKYRRRTT